MDTSGPITSHIQSDPISLVVATFGNQLVKPLLFIPNTPIYSDDSRFEQHTPYPTRDNVENFKGKPVIATITLESPAYEVESYDTASQSYKKAKMESVKLDLTTVLVDVQNSKNIVKTAINGLNGTVKEFVAKGDYSVTLRGALVNPTGTAYPLDQVKKLNAILNCPAALNVTSDFLSIFPIHYLVVETWTFPQKEGLTNTQLFEINCYSDNPVDIIKIKTK